MTDSFSGSEQSEYAEKLAEIKGWHKSSDPYMRQCAALAAELEAAREMLIIARDAIASAPADAFGEGETTDGYHRMKYAIRDELVNNISKALTAYRKTQPCDCWKAKALGGGDG